MNLSSAKKALKNFYLCRLIKFMKNFFYILKSKITFILSRLKEPWFFYLLMVLNLVPGFYRKILPSMDGGAHLYNAQLIRSLIFNSDSIVHQFFKLNPEIVPNWSGHFILSLLGLFLPAFIAEKTLLTLYLIGLPIVFRRLIKTLSPQNIWISYFVFLFTYHFLFLLGFYNYSIALILLFITLNYWVINLHQSYSISKFLYLFLLITLTYLSHIFVFAFLLFILGVYLFFATVFSTQNSTKAKLNFLIKKSLFLVLAALLPLIFFVLYFYYRPSSGMAFYESTNTLFWWIIDTRPWIVYDYHREAIINRVSGGIILLLFLILLINRVLKYKKNQDSWIKINDFLFLIALVSLLLFFILPDSDGQAGFVSVRFGFLFIVFLILGLTTSNYPKLVKVIALLLILVTAFVHNFGFNKTVKDQYKIVKSIVQASNYIQPNKVVLPINFSKNWLSGNFSNYLGIDKPMVILHNYEASTGYFPVLWNNTKMPNTLLGELSKITNCLNWPNNYFNGKYSIDYVFILIDYKDEELKCIQPIETLVNQYYNLIYHDDYCLLFIKK